jgi:hypothetical protein
VSQSELISAIRGVITGKSFFSPKVKRILQEDHPERLHVFAREEENGLARLCHCNDGARTVTTFLVDRPIGATTTAQLSDPSASPPIPCWRELPLEIAASRFFARVPQKIIFRAS